MNEWAKLDVIGPECEVSRHGEVRQKTMVVAGREFKDFVRKASVNKAGYHYMAFREDGKQKNYYIHRLVAETFIDNPDNKPFVNHINGDKGDNTVFNLEWVTTAENNQHARETGLLVTPKGEDSRLSLLTNEQVIEIKRQLAEGKKQRDIAAEFGVHFTLISHIKAGRKWGDVGE